MYGSLVCMAAATLLSLFHTNNLITLQQPAYVTEYIIRNGSYMDAPLFFLVLGLAMLITGGLLCAGFKYKRSFFFVMIGLGGIALLWAVLFFRYLRAQLRNYMKKQFEEDQGEGTTFVMKKEVQKDFTSVLPWLFAPTFLFYLPPYFHRGG